MRERRQGVEHERRRGLMKSECSLFGFSFWGWLLWVFLQLPSQNVETGKGGLCKRCRERENEGGGE